jgi:hypothetical protein
LKAFCICKTSSSVIALVTINTCFFLSMAAFSLNSYFFIQ